LDKIKKFRKLINNAEYYLVTNTDDTWDINSMIIQELGVQRGKPIMAIVGEHVSGTVLADFLFKSTPVLMLDLCDRSIVTKNENHNSNNQELKLDDILNQINDYNNMIMERCLNNSEIKANIGFTWISALSFICKFAKKEHRQAVDRNCKLWKRINDLKDEQLFQ